MNLLDTAAHFYCIYHDTLLKTEKSSSLRSPNNPFSRITAKLQNISVLFEPRSDYESSLPNTLIACVNIQRDRRMQCEEGNRNVTLHLVKQAHGNLHERNGG